MKEVSIFKTSVTVYKSIRRSIPEELDFFPVMFLAVAIRHLGVKLYRLFRAVWKDNENNFWEPLVFILFEHVQWRENG
jgi:hypothetical protein